MNIDTGGTPGTLRCPRCGRALAGEDILYKDESLRPVGCEYCIFRLPAADDARPACPPGVMNRGAAVKKDDAAQALSAAAAVAADFFIAALGDESLSYSQRADAARTILDRALGKAGSGTAPAEEIRVVLEGEAQRYAG